MIAYVSAEGRPSTARKIAAPHLRAGRREINLALPMRPAPELIQAAYDRSRFAHRRRAGAGGRRRGPVRRRPLRLWLVRPAVRSPGRDYPTEVVPGVVSFTAAAAAARAPLVRGTESLVVLPATLSIDALAAHLAQVDAAAILKLGRHLGKVRELLERIGVLHRAIYVEHATDGRERVVRLVDLDLDEAPYFSLILLPAGPSS